jgi:hypothetical protein
MRPPIHFTAFSSTLSSNFNVSWNHHADVSAPNPAKTPFEVCPHECPQEIHLHLQIVYPTLNDANAGTYLSSLVHGKRVDEGGNLRMNSRPLIWSDGRNWREMVNIIPVLVTSQHYV